MTVTTSTHPQPGKKSSRPTVWRQFASKYVDVLICGFISWVVCFTFGWHSYWSSLTLFLFFGEWFWCRDRLNPTAGEYFLGIRYLTSSSSQVVADIQVINAKLKLNGFLLTAGVVELTLAIFLFSGWTFLSQAPAFGFYLAAPLSLIYWALAGFAFFLCSGYLLSGSKLAFGIVPAVHIFFLVDLFLSHPLWNDLLQNGDSAASSLIHATHAQPFPLLDLFIAWSLYVLVTLIFSRKHLVN
jgi:hypothetical protein